MAPPSPAPNYWPQVQQGRFGAKMAVSLLNDGPVTLTLDSPATPMAPAPPLESAISTVSAMPAAPVAPSASVARVATAQCLVQLRLSSALSTLGALQAFGLRVAALKTSSYEGAKCVSALVGLPDGSGPAPQLDSDALVLLVARRCVGGVMLVSADASTIARSFSPSEIYL